MKTLQQRRKTLFLTLFVLLTALIAGSVSAGGWAEIILDDMPGEIHAGESMEVGFMVYQHGKTPVHFLGEVDVAIEPVMTATNMETGETVEFTAVPDKGQVGHFYAQVTFPTEGEWQWQIEPLPLIGATELAPLTILPELSASAVQAKVDAGTTTLSTTPVAATGWSAFAPWAAGLLLIFGLGLLGFAISRRNRQMPVVVDSGD